MHPVRPGARRSSSVSRGGHLYMQTNEVRNCVVHDRRATDGAITEMERTAAGGAGSGTFKPISKQESAPDLQLQHHEPKPPTAKRSGRSSTRCWTTSKASDGDGQALGRELTS
jgi:hypothetical protein